MRTMILIRALLALAVGCGVVGFAHAAYPEQPITMIVPFPPGGGADVAGRLMARHLERKFGKPVTVMNRAGAGGEIGFTATARAKPDGYTIGVVTLPNLVVLPIQRATQYKLPDLAPVANLVDDIGVFFVRRDHRFKTMADLVTEARSKPESVNLATTGPGGLPHLAMLLLQKNASAKLMPIPYSGTTPIRQAVLAGDVDVGFVTLADVTADLQGGLIRVLALTGAERSPSAPDIPTAREQGFEVLISSPRGFAAPANTPTDILRTLSDAMAEIARSPEFQRDATAQLMPISFMPAQEFQHEIDRLDAQYHELWRVSPWEK